MKLKYDRDGLVPAIVQDVTTGKVLMLAYMDEQAVRLTLSKHLAHYYSRSRKELWLKGETSGHIQEVNEVFSDCDGDALLLKVNQRGVACHTGELSCFFNPMLGPLERQKTLADLYTTIADRKNRPEEGSYTNHLLDQGLDVILKKIGEEASEVIIAAKNNRDELIYESCDLLYHLLVLLVDAQITLGDLYKELGKRMPGKD